MNILNFIQNLCCRFYSHFEYKTTQASYSANQEKAIPTHVAAHMNYHHYSAPKKNAPSKPSFKAQVNPPKTSSFSPIPPLKTAPSASFHSQQSQGNFGNKSYVPNSNTFQTQDPLSHMLKNQIEQLEKENKAILTDISINPSQSAPKKHVYPLNHLTYSENVGKQTELSKLNARLSCIDDFCNQEMIEVLHLIMKSDESLNKKLTTLRKETASLEDEGLICENIEHIAFLEQTCEALSQLEAKFQNTQKLLLQKPKFSSSKQEDQIDSFLKKIEKLNQQNHFLKECKQKLPSHAVYDAKELESLMLSFDHESEELAQKTDELRHKLNQADQFSHEMTNHLLDYTEIFKDYSQKLRRYTHNNKQPDPIPVQPTIKPLIPSTSIYTLGMTAQSKTISSKVEEFNQNELLNAANEVAKSLKSLLELTQDI